MNYAIIVLGLSWSCVFSSASVVSKPVRELTDQDFQTTVQNSNMVLATFYSQTCPHCISFLPELDKAAVSLSSTRSPVLVAKVNCGAGGRLTCTQAGVKTVPTIRLYRNGQAGEDFLGQRNAESVVNFVNGANGYNGLNQDYHNYNVNNNGYNYNTGNLARQPYPYRWPYQ